MSKKILITGIHGLLASVLKIHLDQTYRVIGTTRQKNNKAFCLSLETPSQISNTLDEIQPELIIHLASITSVEDCEKNKEKAHQVNVIASEEIAKWCYNNTCRLFFASTDFVFDGEKGEYSEKDTVNPLFYYGQTKIDAEQIITKTLSQHVILRLSLLYGLNLKSQQTFFEKMIHDLYEGKEVILFNDQFRTPLFIDEAVSIIKAIIENESIQGLYHLGGSEKMSRYEMGLIATKELGLNPSPIRAISILKAKDLVKRPLDISLSSQRLEKDLQITHRITFLEALKQIKSRLTNS